MAERQIVDDFVWEHGRDAPAFYGKYPTFYRYWVEGEYVYPEGYLHPSEEDEDHTFAGWLTYFREEDKLKDRFTTVPDDRLENMFFEEKYTPEQVKELIRNSVFTSEYEVIYNVTVFSYSITQERTNV